MNMRKSWPCRRNNSAMTQRSGYRMGAAQKVLKQKAGFMQKTAR